MVTTIKRIIFIFILLSSGLICFGSLKTQNILDIAIDLDKIEHNISDSESHYHFEKLYTRYTSNDTTLTLEDYRHLYYGITFTEKYDPFHFDKERHLKLYNILSGKRSNKRAVKKAIELSEQIVSSSPFDLEVIWLIHNLYNSIDDKVNATIWNDKFQKIVKTILDSGNGLSSQSAITVIDYRHEYVILEIVGFDFSGDQEVKNHVEMLFLEENEYNISNLYFNVERIAAHQEKMNSLSISD